MKNIKFVNDVKNILDKFGPEILTGCAIIFTGLAIKSAVDAAEEATEVKMEYAADIKELEETYKEDPEKHSGRYPWGTKDAAKLAKQRKFQKNIELVMVYKWSLIFGVSSAVCMICSTKLSGSKLAAAYALAKLNEDKLKIALEKTKEMFGEDGEKTIKDKIVEELAIDKNAPFDSTKNPDLNQPDIFVDSYTGAWIETTRENIENASKKANGELLRNHTLPYRKWLMIIGLPSDMCCTITNVGWNSFNPFEIKIEDQVIGNKTMHVIKYVNEPKQDFYHMTR